MSQQQFESDLIETSAGPLELVFLGHGSLMARFDGKTIYVDPYRAVADYGALPEADLVLITHEHRDHLDLEALATVVTEATTVVLTEICAGQFKGGVVMRNGDVRTYHGIRMEAVPAYNRVHKRPSGDPFHPKGNGNGYVLTFGDTRVYVAGDTENIPEMGELEGIDVAFLPMNLPYTMTPEMVAEAAKVIRPGVLYPYHFGSTDTARVVELLRGERDIEVRIRSLA
jgi:L-ascorbate metabolism protein UlaG (beta-lactamase superfamily)